jgi:hypothetical protein
MRASQLTTRGVSPSVGRRRHVLGYSRTTCRAMPAHAASMRACATRSSRSRRRSNTLDRSGASHHCRRRLCQAAACSDAQLHFIKKQAQCFLRLFVDNGAPHALSNPWLCPVSHH